MFATPTIARNSSVLNFLIRYSATIHLDLIISVLSIVSCSAFLSVHASLPHNQNWLLLHVIESY